MPPPQPTKAPSRSRTNIESILGLEREAEKELAFHHRILHSIGWFFGTTYFIAAQCIAVSIWVTINSTRGSEGGAIDPYPFPLLATFLSLEAVLLTSCVLIRQNTLDRTSEHRDHLELQINLLAEQEATRSLDLLQRIAEHLRVPHAKTLQDEALAEETAIEEIARDIEATKGKGAATE